MKKFMKSISMMLCMLMVMSLFAGCTKDGNKQDVKKDNEQVVKKDASEDIKEPITLEVNLSHPDTPEVQAAIEAFKAEERFKHITLNIADKAAEYDTKISTMIAGGKQIDIMTLGNPILMHNWVSAGAIQPIDKYIDELGLDFAELYGPVGDVGTKVGDETYLIPYSKSKWLMIYNKQIFDDAGVSYPSATEPMTFTEYRELAKKITSGEGANKVYGALQLTWPMFWYGPAILELGGGEAFYNTEGLSNIEDPAFAKALQYNFDMQHVDESIPTYAEAKTGKMKATTFMNGKFGMILNGPWVLNFLQDGEKFPRDWKAGIAPMPVNEGETSKQTWGVLGGFGIPISAKYPKEATEVAIYLTEKVAELSTGEIPAYEKYSPDALLDVITEKLAADGITKEEVRSVLFDPEIEFVSEKVTGPNSSQYESVIKEEVEKYLVKAQDLETTISNIKTRGDKAIQE